MREVDDRGDHPDDDLGDFQAQQYPSVEETIRHNAKCLHERKKLFLKDLKTSLAMSAITVSGLVYLKDNTIILLAARCTLVLLIGHKRGELESTPPTHDFTRFLISWYLVAGVLLLFLVLAACHIVFHRYYTRPVASLHGSFTVQFIGERCPSILSLLVLDVLVAVLQLAYFHVSWAITTSDVYASGVSEHESGVGGETDGFGGHVHLLTIDLHKSISEILLHDYQFGLGETTTPEPYSVHEHPPRDSVPGLVPGAFV